MGNSPNQLLALLALEGAVFLNPLFFITGHLRSLLRYFFLIALPHDIIDLFIFGCTGSSLLL